MKVTQKTICKTEFRDDFLSYFDVYWLKRDQKTYQGHCDSIYFWECKKENYYRLVKAQVDFLLYQKLN